MSGPLFERAHALRADLEALDKVRASAGEAGELARLKDSLEREVLALKQALVGREVLAQAGLQISMPPTYEGLRRRAQTLRDRFDKDRRSEVLKKGQAWRSCLEQTGETAKAITGLVRARWQAFESELFSGDAPGAVEKLLAPTASNKAALRRYKTGFEELREQFRTAPQSANDIVVAKRKAEDLKDIAKAFDFDVPADVKSFLEAVLAGGAPLQGLTPSVVNWLKENETYDHYRVVATRQT